MLCILTRGRHEEGGSPRTHKVMAAGHGSQDNSAHRSDSVELFSYEPSVTWIKTSLLDLPVGIDRKIPFFAA